ncbi:MAG: DinB family protein [Methanobacteriota archaeon]|nr:MAG: DinB family protein [Euryarchaeota archaeon]
MSSAGTSLRLPQLGHRIARLSLGSRDDKDLIVLGVVHDHQLLVSFLSDEDFPLSLSDTWNPVRGAQRLPQIGLIPVPFPHPRVPEVLAHVHVDLVDVEREQSGSLSYVMSFIYMKVETRSENPWHSELSRTPWYRLVMGFRVVADMPTAADFRDIYEYNWRVLRDYCDALSALPEEAVLKNREATYQSMKNIFHHIVKVHDGWLNVSAQDDSPDPKVYDGDFDALPTMASVRAYMEKVIAKEQSFLASLQDGDLDRPVQAWWKKRPHPLRDALMQVTFEQAHHLGELIALFWQQDVEPPEMTWIDVRTAIAEIPGNAARSPLQEASSRTNRDSKARSASMIGYFMSSLPAPRTTAAATVSVPRTNRIVYAHVRAQGRGVVPEEHTASRHHEQLFDADRGRYAEPQHVRETGPDVSHLDLHEADVRGLAEVAEQIHLARPEAHDRDPRYGTFEEDDRRAWEGERLEDVVRGSRD